MAGDPYRVVTVCTAMPINIGRRIAVATGAELQRALDAALPGDTILLAPGTTFTPQPPEASFMLRNRRLPEGQWVVLRSTSPAFDASGPIPPRTRVTAANAPLMPRIRAIQANAPAIRAESGARGYRLLGLDIGADASVRQLANLVELGTNANTSADTVPADIVIDRCYLHGNDAGDFRRGVAMNGKNLAVIDSHLENFHDANTDSQAIGGWNGPGPIKIVNNFLEAAGENVMFGGSDPAIPNLVSADIEVRQNVMTKRLSWQSKVAVKNAFELKNARRVVVEGNTFERVWASGQDGTAILLKSANQQGRCPWCVTEYVTFRNNIVRGAAHGMVINAAETGAPGAPLPVKANHIRVENVLFEDIGGAQWGGGGKLLRVFGGVSDLSFTHITSRANPAGILESKSMTDLNPGFVFRFSIVERRQYGIGAGSDEGTKTLTRNFAPYAYGQNVLVNTSADTDQAVANAALETRYPAGTWVVSGWDDVGFQFGTSKLASTSRYARAGDDGKDIGADIGAIAAAQSGGSRSADGCGAGEAVPRNAR